MDHKKRQGKPPRTGARAQGQQPNLAKVPAPVRWDARQVKQLLRAPTTLYERQPWRSWIEQRGGLESVYGYLQAQHLPSTDRQVLALWLEHPGETAAFYTDRLGLSKSSYFEHLATLLRRLAAALDDWDSATGAPEPAAPTEHQIEPSARLFKVPAETSSFFGREEELAAVQRLLQSDVRLLTLTGPGGTGKTRLGIRACTMLAGSFAHGAVFIPLAPVSDPSLVLPTVAHTLGIQDSGAHQVSAELKSWLRSKQLLLMLDNFEQVLAAAPQLVELLQAAPLLKLLITSRARLQVSPEHELIVAPLPVPDLAQGPAVGQLAASPAVALFTARAAAVRRGPAGEEEQLLTAKICRNLDGLPLAIELAAARLKFCSLAALLAQLQQSRLGSLTGGFRDLPERQQTLRNTIGWSYSLLEPAEQRLFRQLAVFAGGCTAAAAAAVAADGESPDTLFSRMVALADNSMLVWQAVDDQVYFSMLETLREYALEELVAHQEEAATRHRHASYYLELAQQVAALQQAQTEPTRFNRLEHEHDNLRAALSWTLEQSQVELYARLCQALWRFWYVRGYMTEGRQWLERGLERVGPALAELRVGLLNAAGLLSWAQTDTETSLDSFEEALTLARQRGDARQVVAGLTGMRRLLLNAGDYQRAEQCCAESLTLCAELGDDDGYATALSDLGWVAIYQNQSQRAEQLGQESLTRYRALKHEQGVASATAITAWASLQQHQLATARRLFAEAVAICKRLSYVRGIESASLGQGWVELFEGDYAQTRLFFTAALKQNQNSRAYDSLAEALEGLGCVAAAAGAAQRAGAHWGAAQALRERVKAQLPPVCGAAYDRLLAALRAPLDQQALERGYQHGLGLEPAEALEEALAPLMV